VPRLAPIAALAASLALGVAASGCGSGSDAVTTGASGATAAPSNAHKGGTLNVLMAGDIDYMDPGQSYYGPGYMLQNAVNRQLYTFEPGDVAKPHPDLATGPPQVSKDGKTITIHIRRGVRFAPPVNREVVADDIKYAIERGFSAHVANAYVGLYLSALQGAPSTPPNAVPNISGIQTPDAHTIVLKLSKPEAPTVIGGLTLPITVPVPRSYAAPFDAHNPTTYGQHVAFTGPYMVAHDATGKLTGYKPGRSIVVVRNPNWNAKLDDRPAYVDKIVYSEGNTDQDVASRRVLDGAAMINGDFSPTPAVIQSALKTRKTQISITPNATFRAVALNTKLKPFDNLNVRKAVLAAFDRNALLLSRGGTVQGQPAWSFLPPGIPGYTQGGGAKPPKQFDYLQSYSGNLALAKSYMRKAGYPSGLYTGNAHPLEVGVEGGTPERAAEITQAQLARLGIHVKLRLTTSDAYLTKFCGVPKANVAVCPSTNWGKDFPDGQTLLQPTFAGDAISQTYNANPSLLNVPSVNRAIAAAAALPQGAARDAAWGKANDAIVAQAPAVPFQWDKVTNIESRNVAGVVNLNNGQYDLSYTSVR
jgi:peptide/nickel transport system substrate-binding protein